MGRAMANTPIVIDSTTPSMWAALRRWSSRRWGIAGLAAIGSALVLGLPTDVIPNPVFGRQGTPVTWWSYPVLAITAILSGLLFATYIRDDRRAGRRPDAADGCVVDDVAEAADRPSRVGGFGGLLTFFAVGCPICNKVVVLALGTVGAVKWFAPVQPVLGVLSLALLAWSLRVRLRGEIACPVDIDTVDIDTVDPTGPDTTRPAEPVESELTA